MCLCPLIKEFEYVLVATRTRYKTDAFASTTRFKVHYLIFLNNTLCV